MKANEINYKHVATLIAALIDNRLLRCNDEICKELELCIQDLILIEELSNNRMVLTPYNAPEGLRKAEASDIKPGAIICYAYADEQFNYDVRRKMEVVDRVYNPASTHFAFLSESGRIFGIGGAFVNALA